jgi:hypothetical protein
MDVLPAILLRVGLLRLGAAALGFHVFAAAAQGLSQHQHRKVVPRISEKRC